MNIYNIVLNKQELKIRMMDFVNQLNPIQRDNYLTILSDNLIKIDSKCIKFIVKDDYLISIMQGVDIDEIFVGDGVILNREEIDFLRSKANMVYGLG